MTLIYPGELKLTISFFAQLATTAIGSELYELDQDIVIVEG